MAAIVVAAMPVHAQIPPPPEKQPGKAASMPRLFVEKRIHEIGNILEGETAEVAWKLENRGTANLVIDRASAACGCTVVKLRDEDKIVPPGKALDLNVAFNSTGRFGEQNKEVVVFSNDPTEPELKLAFRANVDQLFHSDPATVVNLRVLRRGETVQKPLELMPASGKGDLTITALDVAGGGSFDAKAELLEKKGAKGSKVSFSILESAPLGPVSGTVNVKFRVGDREREKLYSVRGEVVGDLTWLPKVVDATRQPSLAGSSLAPVTVTSTDQRPFKIIEATGGPLLKVSFGPGQNPKPGIEYSVQVGINENAAPGPFGTSLRIVTDSLDQPVVEVPVFGIVAPRVEVEPTTVLLRQDGTPTGTQRRLRIKTADASDLMINSVESDSPAVGVTMDRQATAKYTHLAYLEVRLTGTLPSGTHHTKIRVATSVAGAEMMEIPVRIEVP